MRQEEAIPPLGARQDLDVFILRIYITAGCKRLSLGVGSTWPGTSVRKHEVAAEERHLSPQLRASSTHAAHFRSKHPSCPGGTL
jgi:hypothetical protein